MPRFTSPACSVKRGEAITMTIGPRVKGSVERAIRCPSETRLVKHGDMWQVGLRIQPVVNQQTHDRAAPLEAGSVTWRIAVLLADRGVCARLQQCADRVLLAHEDCMHEWCLSTRPNQVESRQVLGESRLDERAPILLYRLKDRLSAHPRREGQREAYTHPGDHDSAPM
eukprot:scaffold204405_cov37-Tisochrysis_lutea.AAC.1